MSILRKNSLFTHEKYNFFRLFFLQMHIIFKKPIATRTTLFMQNSGIFCQILSGYALNRFGDGSNHSDRRSTWLQSVVRKLLLKQHQSVVVKRLLLKQHQSVVVKRLLQSKPVFLKRPDAKAPGLFLFNA